MQLQVSRYQYGNHYAKLINAK